MENKKDYKSMNIYQKMIETTNLIERVKKSLTVEVTKTSSYKAVSEVDIIAEVKKAEYEVGVYSYPIEREIIGDEVLTTTTQYGDRNQFHIRLKTVYRFINIDKPGEFIDITSYSDGIDSGDKTFGKAMTYGDKYALMKAYKIETGDDPDKEASQQYKKTENKKEIPTSKNKVTDKQIDMIEKLYSEEEITKMLGNLKLDSLSDITIEQASKMIASRKGA